MPCFVLQCMIYVTAQHSWYDGYDPQPSLSWFGFNSRVGHDYFLGEKSVFHLKWISSKKGKAVHTYMLMLGFILQKKKRKNLSTAIILLISYVARLGLNTVTHNCTTQLQNVISIYEQVFQVIFYKPFLYCITGMWFYSYLIWHGTT